MPDTTQSMNILGTRISPINPSGTLHQVEQWISSDRTGRYVCVTGVHGIMEGLDNAAIRTAHNRADLCVPDGMPISWIGWLKGHRQMDRVYGPDLMDAVLRHGIPLGWRHYFYGGKPGVADQLSHHLQDQLPGLRIAGTWCPPFRPLNPAEEQELHDAITAAQPDCLWVGLSTPKQELFMADWHDRLPVKVMFGVGAAFDYLSGNLRRPPRWIQRIGMEWLFRLCLEPRRLAPRYLRNNPRFIWHLALQWTGLRQYPDTD